MSGSAGVHPTAIIDPSARLGPGVTVGPFTIVESEAVIGEGTIIESHVTIKQGTIIGKHCHVFVGAVLGHWPQDAKFKGEDTRVEIGDNNVIREYVTIHRATMPGGVTRLGNHDMLMAYCHIGHDCVLHDRVIIASYGGISGHVTLEDNVTIGGMVGIHQFVHVGRLAMIGGITKVTQDIPPFMMADGRPSEVTGLNSIGLQRNGIPSEERAALKEAYKLLYRSGLNTTQALERIESDLPRSDPLDYLVWFIKKVYAGKSGRQDQPT